MGKEWKRPALVGKEDNNEVFYRSKTVFVQPDATYSTTLMQHYSKQWWMNYVMPTKVFLSISNNQFADAKMSQK